MERAIDDEIQILIAAAASARLCGTATNEVYSS